MSVAHKINILDCTLRDGGYYTNWIFKKDVIERYLKTLKRNNINYVEIGFKFFNKKNYHGQFANINEEVVKWLYEIAKNNYGIMINSSELKNFSTEKIEKVIKKNFLDKKKSNLSFIRIASHISEATTTIAIAKALNKLGYKVFINLMQITMIKMTDFKKFYNLVKNYCDVFYVADSLGSLKEKKKIIQICDFLKKKEFGIHAHDNQGLALKNTILFSKLGAKWLDATILGMGRGPGNVDTIKLIQTLTNTKVIGFNKTKNDFMLLKKKFNWGKNHFYELASKKNIHPTYIQEILSYKGIEKKMILKFIQCLSKFETHTYSTGVLENEISSINNKIQNIKRIKTQKNKNADILIFGSGKSLSNEHFFEVINFIKKKRPLVLSLNFNKGLLDKYIDFFVVSHFNRIFLNNKNIKKNINKVIMPFIPEIEKKYSKKIIIYPLMVKKNIFKIFKRNCILPNMLSFSYAVSISRLIGVKNIYLAGFEGYSNHDEMFKNLEMFNTIEIIKKSLKMNIKSISPTIYPIKIISSSQIL